MAASARTFTTGLEFLDRRLDGGIGVGRLLALTAPPSSQSELLLRQLASTRRTTFVSTHRPAAEVREWAVDGDADLDVTRVAPEELLQRPDAAFDSVASESFLVVDTADALEHASRAAYLDLLDRLKRRLVETDSVGVLHCIDRDEAPPRRALTLSRADIVWQIEMLVQSREIKTRLLVTKSRFGRALPEPIPVLLTDRVQIDTSQRIA